MQSKPISEASTPQIIEFAKTILQLDNPPTERNALIAALTQGGWTKDHIMIPDEAPPMAEAAAPAPVLAQFEDAGEKPVEMTGRGFAYWTNPPKGAPKCPMVVCRILSTDRPGGNEPAAPIVNNSPPLIIPRGVLVRIPLDFYRILKQAGGTQLLPGDKPTDELVRVNYSEYPMTDVELPTQAEADAWDAWSGQNELGRPKAQAA